MEVGCDASFRTGRLADLTQLLFSYADARRLLHLPYNCKKKTRVHNSNPQPENLTEPKKKLTRTAF